MTDYSAYIRSPAWRLKRAARLERDGGRCVVCGERAVNVHHISYENLGAENVQRDLVSVCRACHLRLDAIEKAERRERRSSQQEGNMNKPGVVRGWLDWRVLVLLAVITAALLLFVAVEGAGAAPLDSTPRIAQRVPRGWRYTVQPTTRTARLHMSIPGRR